MTLLIEGISCFGSFGAGRQALVQALLTPPKVALTEPFPALPSTNTSAVSRYLAPKILRQADHFTRMALLGAYAALEDVRLGQCLALASCEHGAVSSEFVPFSPEFLEDTGIILVSGYGLAATTFAFLDSFLEFGAEMASALAFSHSVHNIPAASIALKLNLAGPCCTLCQMESSVAAGLLTAQGWLQEKRVRRVIFGAMEEITPLLTHITARLVHETPKKDSGGVLGLHARRERPLGEGSVFFCLCDQDALALSTSGSAARYGSITDVSLRSSQTAADFVELAKAQSSIFFASGAVSCEVAALPAYLDGSVAYGNIPIAPAFDMILALNALHGTDQTTTIGQTDHPLRSISCINSSTTGTTSTITIARNIGEPGT